MAGYYGGLWSLYFNESKRAKSIFGEVLDFTNSKAREPVMHFELGSLFNLALGIQSMDLPLLKAQIDSIQKLSTEILRSIAALKWVEILHLSISAAIYCRAYKSALKLINELQTVKPGEIRPDIRFFSRVLFIVVHFELGNIDMVDQGIKAAKIAFKRKGVSNSFYEAVFRMFHTLYEDSLLASKSWFFRGSLKGSMEKKAISGER